jgi:hypothetical protein
VSGLVTATLLYAASVGCVVLAAGARRPGEEMEFGAAAVALFILACVALGAI